MDATSTNEVLDLCSGGGGINHRGAGLAAMPLQLPAILLFTPFVRPFRWSRLVLTYGLPLIPFLVLFDGTASMLRLYLQQDLRTLLPTVPDWESFEWDIGATPTGPFPIGMLHLTGVYRFWLLSLVMLIFVANNSIVGAQKLIAPADVEPMVGTWTLDATKSGADSAERRVVTLGPGWMRVEIHRPGDDRPPTLIYNLDGSPNVSPFGAGTAKTELRRDADGIVTVALITINDRPVTVQERLKMSPAGQIGSPVSRLNTMAKLLEPSIDVCRALTSAVGRTPEGVVDRRQPTMGVGSGAGCNRREVLRYRPAERCNRPVSEAQMRAVDRL